MAREVKLQALHRVVSDLVEWMPEAHMTPALAKLEPHEIWKYFDAIGKIPRGSGNEAAAREYVLAQAARLGLESAVDAAGNTVVRKPARPGREQGECAALQGHLDMVCVKNQNVAHDFTRDPIPVYRDGDWVKARGTTLGADNGIGVAAALAVMESTDIAHGPLEFVFTIDEETGLTGAGNFARGVLHAKYLLNLDNEEQDTLCIGCAGGLNTNAYSSVTRRPPRYAAALRIQVTGLLGGHSGVDIHRGRGNAILILARILQTLREQVDFELAGLNGGAMRNVIPRDASATVLIDPANERKLRATIESAARDIGNELGSADPGLDVLVEPADKPHDALAPQDAARIVDLLVAVPNGVVSMSPEIAGLVQTSTNVGTIAIENGRVSIATLQRSAIDSARFAAGRAVQTALRLAGFEIENAGGYPGWKPEPESDIVHKAKAAHEAALGKPARLIAMHAGLECGVIGEKYPGMQMIAFGPEIVGAHSPDERVDIPSVAAFWTFLKELLARL